MKGYLSIDELWLDTLTDLLNQPVISSRAGECRELQGYRATLVNIDQTFLLNPRRKLSPHYAAAEVLWYLQPTKSIEMISAYAPQYERFAENGEAHGAYGWRIFHGVNQLEFIIRLLQANPESRQAIVSIWNVNDLVGAQQKMFKDVPCTISLQFLTRDNTLNLIATMRSNDVWLGLPYDVFAFTCIQRLVALGLGVAPGWYIHQVGSEHVYEKNVEAAKEALTAPYNKFINRYRTIHNWPIEQWSLLNLNRNIQEAVRSEEFFRKNPPTAKIPYFNMPSGCLLDLTACCADKWGRSWAREEITSPILRGVLDAYC